MPPRNLLRAFLALWIVTGLVLLIGSVETVRQMLATHGNPHIVLLALAEAAAALLFLIPRTTRVGASALVVIIGIAFLFHAILGQLRADLVVFGVVVSFVGVHRPLTRAQLGAALGHTA